MRQNRTNASSWASLIKNKHKGGNNVSDTKNLNNTSSDTSLNLDNFISSNYHNPTVLSQSLEIINHNTNYNNVTFPRIATLNLYQLRKQVG